MSGKDGKRFFFEKKKQKTFIPGSSRANTMIPAGSQSVLRIRSKRNKVFLLLFLQKKKTLPSSPPRGAAPPAPTKDPP